MKRCRNIEKSVWRSLSDYEEHVETIHKRIDDTIEQLVRFDLFHYLKFKIKIIFSVIRRRRRTKCTLALQS